MVMCTFAQRYKGRGAEFAEHCRNCHLFKITALLHSSFLSPLLQKHPAYNATTKSHDYKKLYHQHRFLFYRAPFCHWNIKEIELKHPTALRDFLFVLKFARK